MSLTVSYHGTGLTQVLLAARAERTASGVAAAQPQAAPASPSDVASLDLAWMVLDSSTIHAWSTVGEMKYLIYRIHGRAWRVQGLSPEGMNQIKR